MKNADVIHLRYMGEDDNRRFILQRADGLIWNGGGWSRLIDDAFIFFKYDDAVVMYTALMQARYAGKPTRTFKLEVTLTLVADDVEGISLEAVRRYVADAVRIQTENSIFGDGPTENSFVHVRLEASKLKETRSGRKTF